MSCFSRHSHRHRSLGEIRREIELELSKYGFKVVEAQDIGHSLVFKIRKLKSFEAKQRMEGKKE